MGNFTQGEFVQNVQAEYPGLVSGSSCMDCKSLRVAVLCLV